MKMKNFLIIIIFFCNNFSTYAQQIIINDVEGNRNLAWSDFIGTPESDSSYFAYTYWNLNFKYTSIQFSGDSGVLEGVVVSEHLTLSHG